MKLIKYVFFLALVLLLNACTSCKKKKKEDVQPPTISVISPSVGTSYNMFDTIRIDVQLDDETQLTKIEIILRDLNGISVQPGGSQSLNGTSKRYTTDYILSEYRLKTGNYNLEFSVSDGSNVTVKNVQIHITESPTYLTGYYFVYRNTTSHTLNKLDTNFVNTATINAFGAYGISGVSLYYQQLYLLNPSAQTLTTYKIQDHLVKWSLASIGINNSVCAIDENKIFVSKASANVVSYNQNGTLIRSYISNETFFYVKHIFLCGNYLVVNIEDNSNSASKKTIIYEVATGIVKRVITDNTECTQAFSHASDEIYIVSKTNAGTSIVGNLNMITLNYYQPLNSASPIKSSVLIDTGTLLFSCADGSIKQYTFSSGNLIPLLTGTIADKLYYSPTFNKLYIAGAKTFTSYNKAPFALSLDKQLVALDTIRDFHVVYNK